MPGMRISSTIATTLWVKPGEEGLLVAPSLHPQARRANQQGQAGAHRRVAVNQMDGR